MASQLVEVLPSLLADVPGADAIVLERWEPPAESASDAVVEERFRELAAVFEAVVGEIAGEWGAPLAMGSAADDGFPAWSDAFLLATWQHDGHTAFVALRQDDPTEPTFIELGAVTTEEIATLTLARE